jgi:23S rRNA (cytidine1920-2'-O)/16S rRNA (cytidine1409-2'-O)-methyltransferase
MAKQRLDIILVDRGLFPSREQAQRAIRAGWVRVDGQVLDKPSQEVKQEQVIKVQERSPFVSRGGEKLIGALQNFAIPVSDRLCLDGGISTGGFTDCLLQLGAKRIYGVDVGYGQVAWSIRCDPRVILKERTNLRYLTPEALYGQGYNPAEMADFAVLDLSFISLTKVLPALWHLLRPPREALLLVKPQFEAERSQIGKNGIVRDLRIHEQALTKVSSVAESIGWQKKGTIPAPIKGRSGNQEYWLWLTI